MSRRFSSHCLPIALLIGLHSAAAADRSGAVTLPPHSSWNLDTGAVAGAGGDLFWDGSFLTPQGVAATHNLGKYGSRLFKSIRAKDASAALYKPLPIASATLVAGDIFGVRTNGGNYAKVIVTGVNGSSLSLEYTTFITAPSPAAAGGPVVTRLQNNYSYILPGLPNYGIAPGSLFLIFGTGLSSSAPPVLQSSSGPGLPTTLNQTSVSVTVGGVTTSPALYYTSATQVAAVLPSTTPVGTGTLTLTYNGQTSASVPILVVASAVGLDTLYGTGNGIGVITDNNTGQAFGLTHSVMPGQVAVLWGSGIGADAANDDRTYPMKQDNLTGVPLQIFVGGISANIIYRGRSQYPGVDQIDISIPGNVQPGCFVSVVALVGSVASNTVTIPVDAGGGPCSDAVTGLTGTQIQAVANKSGGAANALAVTVIQNTSQSGNVSGGALAIAGSMNSAFYGMGYEFASQGSCILVPPEQSQSNNIVQNPLDVGAVQVSGPGGVSNLPSGGGGFYQGQVSAPLAAGAYTFSGSGGKDVGKFSVAVNLTTPLTITNKPALATITRSQGVTVTWSGGFANGDVQVSAAVGDQYGSVRFFCHAPTSAGQLAIPPSILLGMPAGGGDLVVTNATALQSFTATGADIGLAGGVATFKLATVLK